MKILQLFSLPLGFLFVYCGHQIDQEDLYGNWQALTVVDAGDTVTADLSSAQLVLKEDGNFSYQATPLDHYQGIYELKQDLISLFSAEPADTFVVQVLEVDQKELHLRMNHKGVERLLSMKRPD